MLNIEKINKKLIFNFVKARAIFCLTYKYGVEIFVHGFIDDGEQVLQTA